MHSLLTDVGRSMRLPFLVVAVVLSRLAEAVPPQVTGVSLSIVSGQAAIRVNWNSPSVEGTFIRYDIQYKTSSQSWDAATTETVEDQNTVTVDLPGLQRGTTYNVRVRAVSDVGNGPYSAEATFTVPRLPARVSDVRVTAEENGNKIQITVSWTPPLSDRDITHYDVDLKHGAETLRLLNTTNTTAVITVTSGRTYSVKVRAVSAAGSGDWSDTVSIAPPSAPTGVTATSIDSSSVTITWSSDGFKYRISAQREGSSERPSQDPVSPPHTITGLDSNTGYTITIEAYSPLGQAGRNITVYTVPEAPSSLNLEVVSSTVIRVTWTAPPNADRLPLTYLISYQSEFDSGMEEASTQPVELTGLHPFAEYTVSVQARNTGGQLSVSVIGKRTTLSAAPSSPPRSVLIVGALRTHDSLTCAWQLPVRANRNGIITSYFIIVTRDSGAEQQPLGNFTKVVDNPSLDAPTHLRYTFNTLIAITFYGIRIAAVTSGGTGVFSDLLSRRTNHDLYVSMLTIQVDSDTSSTISWAAPEGEVVSSYRVYYGVYLSGAFIMRTTSTTSQQLTSLTPETPIEVSVIPDTGQGPGGSVSRIFFTREGVPTVPVKDVTVMRINNGVSLRVSWTPLSLHEARGWPLYTVIVESTSCGTTRATLTRNTSSSTVDVDGLDPSTWYSVRVQVGTSAGTSAALINVPVELQAPCVTPATPDSNVGVTVGVFVAGLVVGILGLLLVIGILFGACKLIKQPNENGSKESGSDPNAVEMTQSPAYESVAKAYEDVDHPTQQRGVPKKINEEYAIIE